VDEHQDHRCRGLLGHHPSSCVGFRRPPGVIVVLEVDGKDMSYPPEQGLVSREQGMVPEPPLWD
jgi:hypothetical protein